MSKETESTNNIGKTNSESAEEISLDNWEENNENDRGEDWGIDQETKKSEEPNPATGLLTNYRHQ